MKKNSKIFYGDLHSHSEYSSDAVNTFEEIEKKVLDYGNDFHAVTDHNSYEMNFQYPRKNSNIEFIFGIEMTNRFGHYNFLGVERPVKTCEVNNENELLELIEIHKNNGGYVTYNHPFSPKSRICRLPITKYYCDFVEIWNGPWAIHNGIALKWWHNQLLNNVFYPICGGSDTHDLKDDRNYGTPLNCILASANEQSVLLSQLKKGHSFILSRKNVIDIEFDKYIFGDKVLEPNFTIKFSSSDNKYKLHVITNENKTEYLINDAPSLFSLENVTFVRFEAYDENEECIFISNPVFNDYLFIEKENVAIKLSQLNMAIEEKNNKYINIDGLNTKDIYIINDFESSPITLVMASIISNDYKLLNLIDRKKIDSRSYEQINLLSEFLKKSCNGKIIINSTRCDLLQLEIEVNDLTTYQVEIHLGNHNYCLCENFNIIAFDSF